MGLFQYRIHLILEYFNPFDTYEDISVDNFWVVGSSYLTTQAILGVITVSITGVYEINWGISVSAGSSGSGELGVTVGVSIDGVTATDASSSKITIPINGAVGNNLYYNLSGSSINTITSQVKLQAYISDVDGSVIPPFPLRFKVGQLTVRLIM